MSVTSVLLTDTDGQTVCIAELLLPSLVGLTVLSHHPFYVNEAWCVFTNQSLFGTKLYCANTKRHLHRSN